MVVVGADRKIVRLNTAQLIELGNDLGDVLQRRTGAVSLRIRSKGRRLT